MFTETKYDIFTSISFFLPCSWGFLFFLLRESPRETPEALLGKESDTLHILFDSAPVFYLFDTYFFYVFDGMFFAKYFFPATFLVTHTICIDTCEIDNIFFLFHAWEYSEKCVLGKMITMILFSPLSVPVDHVSPSGALYLSDLVRQVFHEYFFGVLCWSLWR